MNFRVPVNASKIEDYRPGSGVEKQPLVCYTL